MNRIDIIVIFSLLFGALLGYKRGFTKALVSFLGLIFIIAIAYTLKNPISSIFYTYLPFFKFGDMVKGGVIFNILVYEWIAFFLIFGILVIVWKILLWTTKIFEKILSATIVLGIPSKILGMIVGLLESLVIVYIVLFILSLPAFSGGKVKTTKLTNRIVNQMPILSSFGKKTKVVSQKLIEIKDKYKEEENANTYHLETLDLFLEYKIVSVQNIEKLIKKGKLKMHNIDSVLQKYK